MGISINVSNGNKPNCSNGNSENVYTFKRSKAAATKRHQQLVATAIAACMIAQDNVPAIPIIRTISIADPSNPLVSRMCPNQTPRILPKRIQDPRSALSCASSSFRFKEIRNKAHVKVFKKKKPPVRFPVVAGTSSQIGP